MLGRLDLQFGGNSSGGLSLALKSSSMGSPNPIISGIHVMLNVYHRVVSSSARSSRSTILLLLLLYFIS